MAGLVVMAVIWVGAGVLVALTLGGAAARGDRDTNSQAARRRAAGPAAGAG